MLTPRNIEKNWIFISVEFKDEPVKIGYQCEKPAKIEKMAPILNT